MEPYYNMKTAAWNYDDLWLGSAFSNGVIFSAQMYPDGSPDVMPNSLQGDCTTTIEPILQSIKATWT